MMLGSIAGKTSFFVRKVTDSTPPIRIRNISRFAATGLCANQEIQLSLGEG